MCRYNGNISTYVRTVEGVYKEILDNSHKYNINTPQQSVYQILTKYNDNFSKLDQLYDNEVSINEALRNSDRDDLLLFAPYIYSLLKSLQDAKRHYYSNIYRGIDLESKPIATYKNGLLSYWPGFTSCTKDIHVATKWAG